MKLAVIGSRTLEVDLAPYVPDDCTTMISGGAVGIDACAARFARARGIDLIECLPDYARFERAAPLRRTDKIVELADLILAFWDGLSPGTRYGIERARAVRKPCSVFVWDEDRFVQQPLSEPPGAHSDFRIQSKPAL